MRKPTRPERGVLQQFAVDLGHVAVADAAVLLRARVLLDTPVAELPLFELTPQQLALDLPL